MNENNQYNTDNVRPYKASGNLNTVIGNPSININDTMNVNIQNMATNHISVNNDISAEIDNNILNNSNQQKTIVTNMTINDNNIDTKVLSNSMNNDAIQRANNQDSQYVNKTYVTTNNKPKKKNIQLNLGSEFKIAFLIMVILMIFIFLLPKISEFFRGY